MVEKKLMSGMKVLIVEDNVTNRKLIKILLKRIGIKQIYEAENGIEAIKILERQIKDIFRGQSIDLVLCDIQMPKMDGIEFLSEVRKRKELKDLPVIMITAASERETVLASVKLGIDGYIVKPITHAIIEENVTKVFKKINSKGKSSETQP